MPVPGIIENHKSLFIIIRCLRSVASPRLVVVSFQVDIDENSNILASPSFIAIQYRRYSTLWFSDLASFSLAADAISKSWSRLTQIVCWRSPHGSAADRRQAEAAFFRV